MQDIDAATLCEQLDKALITEIVQTERAARDQAQWERMRACYHPDSRVEISWFQGTGPQFVAASAQAYDAGARSLHQMGPTVASVRRDRGLAETGCAILLHGAVSGVKVTVTGYCRLHGRLERRDGRWRLSGFRIVYQHDTMAPLNPSDRLVLDADRLGSYRASYRFVSYLLAENGEVPSPALAGADRPETVAALLRAEDAWLGGD